MPIASKTYQSSTFRLLLPLTSNFLDFRSRINPKLIDLTCNYSINGNNILKNYTISSRFSKIEFSLESDPQFSAFDTIDISIHVLLKNPQRNNETSVFLLDVIDNNSKMITQQFTFNEIQYNQPFFNFQVSFQNFQILRSYSYIDLFLNFEINEGFDFSNIKIKITFPENVSLQCLNQSNIRWVSKSIDSVDFMMDYQIYKNSTNGLVTLVLKNDRNTYLNYSDYFIKISNLFTPKLILDQFCLGVVLNSQRFRRFKPINCLHK